MPKEANKALARARERKKLESKLLTVVGQQYRLAIQKRILETQIRLLDLEDQVADPYWDSMPQSVKNSIIQSKRRCVLTINKLTAKLQGGE